ncbi:DUF1542 domain-containing protein, partial [Staphylococcus aureus]|uniref:DUF1542 domain-containing protein n=1 Tax=Staphylococcus aureus TaxID=1280 RepID=UPI0011A9F4B9
MRAEDIVRGGGRDGVKEEYESKKGEIEEGEDGSDEEKEVGLNELGNNEKRGLEKMDEGIGNNDVKGVERNGIGRVKGVEGDIVIKGGA